ncbi:Vegetative incompatibility protein HET-E-1-like protein 25 [Colletotrichum chlorophyti]|uniref:Vegetative incompatibility protein HET-E-1-like protein 25 n=1 Tax=Colletotrichum chlorophyti TaxID=708187 RepID=A0A1Q8R9N7_9PEZI|nr:Vegetative incompatibility protein HET-E-1-like protein 25 [Colletotrichum chlorophyti]
MTTHLAVGNSLPADDLRPSYEEAIAGGANPAPTAPAIARSTRSASISLHDGTTAPSVLRVRHLGRALCHNGAVTNIAISPRGFVATSQNNKGAAVSCGSKLWDFKSKPSGSGARLVASDMNGASMVVFSPDGRLSAVLERDAGPGDEWRVKMRSGEEGKGTKAVLKGVGKPAVFNHEGSMFAATDPTGVVIVYEAARVHPAPAGVPPAKRISGIVNHGKPTHVRFMPNGMDIVTLSKDGTVRISDARTGRTLRRMEVDNVSTANGLGACALAVSPDGKVVVSVWSRAIYLWQHEEGNVSSWEMNKVRSSEGWPLAVSRDCRLLACRTEEGMDISDLYSGQVLAEIKTATGIEGLVTSAAFSADGKILAVGRYTGVVDVWDLAPFED